MKVGDLVKIENVFPEQDDLGIVVGHWEDPHDGYLYLKVKWFDDEKVDLVEPCCLEVL